MFEDNNAGGMPTMHLGIHPVADFSTILSKRIQQEVNLVGARVDFAYEGLQEDEVLIVATDFATQKEYGMKLGGITNQSDLTETKTHDKVIKGLKLSIELTDEYNEIEEKLDEQK